MLGSFEIIDFFIFELNFLRNMRIFKKNAAIKMGKAIFQNLMSSALFGYKKRFQLNVTYYKSLLQHISAIGGF